MSTFAGDDDEAEEAARVTKLLEDAFELEAEHKKTREDDRQEKIKNQCAGEADLAASLEKAEFDRVLSNPAPRRPEFSFTPVIVPGERLKNGEGELELKRRLRKLRISEILQERHDRRRMLLARQHRDLRTLYRIEREKTNRRGLRGRSVFVRRFVSPGQRRPVICAGPNLENADDDSIEKRKEGTYGVARYVCWQCKARPAQVWIRTKNSKKRIGRCRECCRFLSE